MDSSKLQEDLNKGLIYLRRCWKSFYAGLSEVLPLSPRARAYRLPVCALEFCNLFTRRELQARLILLAIVGRWTGRAAGAGPALGASNCDLRREGEYHCEHGPSCATAHHDRNLC